MEGPELVNSEQRTVNSAGSLILVLLILLVVALGCGGSKSGASTPANATGNTGAAVNALAAGANNAAAAAAAEKPIAIQARALTKEYDDNEVAADGKYRDKQLVVTGQLDDVSETFGSLSVRLKGHNAIVDVMCPIEESQRSAAAALKKGSTVTITGKGDGMTAKLYVGLTECRLQ